MGEDKSPGRCSDLSASKTNYNVLLHLYSIDIRCYWGLELSAEDDNYA